MAEIWDIETDRRFEVDEYLDYVESNVDPRSTDSLAESAWALRALANNRDFVIQAYHDQLKSFWEGNRSSEHQPQSLTIKNSENFYVRTNIWLPVARDSRTEDFQNRLFAYDLPHDHNFDFLTAGYFGEGYTTDVYEYDHGVCVGYVGEDAKCRYLGRYTLTPGRVMMYRAGRDIHIQYAPETVSVSLNLMGRNADLDRQQQYIFDVKKGTLIGGAGDLLSNRLFIVEAAQYLADGKTVEILHSLADTHLCDKTRARAIQSLDAISPEEGERARLRASKKVVELSRMPLITGNYARSYSGA